MNSPTGKHVIVDGKNLPFDTLNDSDLFRDIMKECIVEGGATILDVVVKKFDPQGFTIAFVLAESHASVHTYPEHGQYMMDMFTCGSVDPENIMRAILKKLSFPHNFSWNVLNRGTPMSATAAY